MIEEFLKSKGIDIPALGAVRDLLNIVRKNAAQLQAAGDVFDLAKARGALGPDGSERPKAIVDIQRTVRAGQARLAAAQRLSADRATARGLQQFGPEDIAAVRNAVSSAITELGEDSFRFIARQIAPFLLPYIRKYLGNGR